MAATADAAPVRRKDSEGLPTSSERHSDRDPDAPNGQSGKAVPSNSDRSSTAELGGMILAFIFGGLGFAARIFWIPALVVMAVVFGLILADRRTSRSSKGIVTDIVANVANETRDIFQAAAGTSEEDADEDATQVEEAAPHDRQDPSHAEGSGPGRNASRHLENESPREERDLAAVNGPKTNGDSPARHGGLDLSFTETESKSVTTTGEATVVHDELERETVKDTSEGTDSAVTEAVQAEIDESVTGGRRCRARIRRFGRTSLFTQWIDGLIGQIPSHSTDYLGRSHGGPQPDLATGQEAHAGRRHVAKQNHRADCRRGR
jgi:hypothetical protein